MGNQTESAVPETVTFRILESCGWKPGRCQNRGGKTWKNLKYGIDGLVPADHSALISRNPETRCLGFRPTIRSRRQTNCLFDLFFHCSQSVKPLNETMEVGSPNCDKSGFSGPNTLTAPSPVNCRIAVPSLPLLGPTAAAAHRPVSAALHSRVEALCRCTLIEMHTDMDMETV